MSVPSGCDVDGLLSYAGRLRRPTRLQLAQLAAERSALDGAICAASYGEEMLHKVKMLLDGSTGDEIERIMQVDKAAARRHTRTVGVCAKRRNAGNGIDRNIVGLVQMLGNLSDPSTMDAWPSPYLRRSARSWPIRF